MFCSKCGVSNADGATVCSACNASLGLSTASLQAEKAKEQVKAAMDDAWKTFRRLGLDPVGELLPAYEGLGQVRALGVGVAFGLVFAICFVISARSLPYFQLISNLTGFGGYLKLLIVGFVPFVSLAVACFVGEKVGRGQGSVTSDFFIAGVALLPLGIVLLLSAVIGVANFEVIGTCAIIAVCLNVLLLFAGLTRIGKLSEKAASISVPLMLVASVWIAKVIYTSLFF